MGSFLHYTKLNRLVLRAVTFFGSNCNAKEECYRNISILKVRMESVLRRKGGIGAISVIREYWYGF